MRTLINYGGQEYIAGQSLADVRSAIDEILSTGEPGWLAVNHGRGKLRAAELLIAPGITIALVDSSEPGETD